MADIDLGDATERLFSYGTLQYPDVQLSTFGRLVDGARDALPGYVLDELVITDPEVVALSGSSIHPFARATHDPRDSVPGVVLSITPIELAAADEYEVDDYTRVSVVLASGVRAWFYANASSVTP